MASDHDAHPEFAGYTLSVTESAFIHAHGKITWQPTYWEVRESPAGVNIVNASYDRNRWRHRGPSDQWVDIDEAFLVSFDLPSLVIDRIKERGLI